MLYHISPTYFHDQHFYIQTPTHEYVRECLEDGNVARTCVSDQIKYAMRGKTWTSEYLHVYTPDEIQGDVVENDVIVKHKLVVDALLTREFWLTGLAKARHLFRIKRTEVLDWCSVNTWVPSRPTVWCPNYEFVITDRNLVWE